MSVALLIERPGRDTVYVPVATQGLYVSLWCRGAKALGLVWLPLFETGAPVPREDVPALLDELSRFRSWLEAEAGVSDALRAHVVERLELVVPALNQALQHEDAAIWIG